LGVLIAVGAASLGQGFCQTNLQFTSASATVEDAIILNWASQSNHIYQIQYANGLATNDDGSTAWQVLYDQYPSQGSNTFIGDYGNYDTEPAIPHPKYSPMRFYQLLDEGTNEVASPSVLIVSQTNGQVLTGQVTVLVTATSSQPVLFTTLYVDGQQMDESDDGSNYVLNTCEWPNGLHTLFAVATARSGMSGPSGNNQIYTGYGVSAYLPVTFSNLISSVAFSEPFFEPSLGETQEVTANFAANCNWTLQIQDVNSNTVLNASGSGDSMTFDWDGTGNGETNIPDGVYTYLISAATNGESSDLAMEGGSAFSAGLASSSFGGSEAASLWAVPSADLDDAMPVPLALYPPGSDTNSLTIFSATPADIASLRPSMSLASPRAGMQVTADDSGSGGGGSGPSAQATRTPTRPSTAPTKNAAGTYAIGYYSWPNNQTVNIPENNTLGVCHLDGQPTHTQVTFDNIPEAQTMSQNMERAMKKYGWKLAFERGDQNLPVISIRRNDQGYGGSAIFTQATLGLFLDHGDYSTDPDYNPGSSGSDQTYFRSDADGGDNGWLRMCQFGFGGNLKWMGILACNSLTTYSSMAHAGAIPLSTTHLVCGASTIISVGEDQGQYWAYYLLSFFQRESIAQAWSDAGRRQYKYATNMVGTTTFRVAGYPECMGDTVLNNTAPYTPSMSPGNLTHQDTQVYP
jgi:hypothetical protein